MKNGRKMKKEYFIMFIALLALCYLFPYTGDDWAWGSQIGIERLNSWFDNYSGRYFGNLIVLVLTRNRLLRTITMATCLSGIVIIMNKLTGEKKIGFYVIAICLLFLPVDVLRQSIVWTSGFANYTTSIFLTLIYIYYTRNVYGDEKPNYSNMSIIPLAILGILNALIVEHLTVYNVALSIYIIIFTLYKFKKVYIQHLVYFMGTMLGTLYMFSNSVYSSVLNGTDGYRTVSSEKGVIYKVGYNYLQHIMEEGFLNNVILNVILFFICLTIWGEIKENLSKKNMLMGRLCIEIICAYTVISVINEIGNGEQIGFLKYVEGGITVLYVLALFVFIIIQSVDLNKKIKLMFILGSIGCIMASVLVVSPIGSRCFFVTYIMFIWLTMELYTLISEVKRDKIGKFVKYAVMITIISFFYLFYIYGAIFISDKNRVEKVIADANNEGKGAIEIEKLPYEDYVWYADPTESVWEERFKLFYGIDSTVSIKCIENIHNK